jgi:exopolyphosphatase / guanosine-5'-triphosphate,3'-diphosphate pyrophosphatase
VSPVAALDCGTNALRLLVSDDGVDLAREMRTVRLGEGVDKTGMFAAAALERTFTALDEYVAIMAAHGVTRMRFVATSASRDVVNREAFVSGVRSRIGIDPEVISGEEEAALSFAGATQSLAVTLPALVVDLGGGSTEFVLGTNLPIASRSVDIGCVRMTERHLHADPATSSEIAAAVVDIDDAIDRAAHAVDLTFAKTLIGVAGTVTTVAAMAHELPRYDAALIHGLVTSPDRIREVAEQLLVMSRAERATLPFMHPGRVDVIGAGALVLARIAERVGLPVVASEHDLLDAIAAELAAA